VADQHYTLSVLDKKIPENSFEANSSHIWDLLYELQNTYGYEVVRENFDALIKGEIVSFEIANKHTVTAQISKED
jgi:hypothetical protein